MVENPPQDDKPNRESQAPTHGGSHGETQGETQDESQGESNGLPLSTVARPAPMPLDQVEGGAQGDRQENKQEGKQGDKQENGQGGKPEGKPEDAQQKEQVRLPLSASRETKPLTDFAPKGAKTKIDKGDSSVVLSQAEKSREGKQQAKKSRKTSVPIAQQAKGASRITSGVKITVGLVAILVGGIFLLSWAGHLPQFTDRLTSSFTGQIVRIEAPAEPIKRRPEDPGGEFVPYQNEDLLNRESQSYTRTLPPDEKPLPEVLAPPEPPESKPAVSEVVSAEGQEEVDGQETEEVQVETKQETEQGAEQKTQQETQQETQKEVASGVKVETPLVESTKSSQVESSQVESSQAVSSQAADEESKESVESTDPVKPEEALTVSALSSGTESKTEPEAESKSKSEPESESKSEAESSTESNAAYDGPLWVLQVGSFRSREDAQKFSQLYADRYTFLRELRDGVEEAQVNGIQYFRAYYGPWKTSTRPLQICSRLKSAKSECLVKRLR